MSGPTSERRLEMLGEFAEMALSLARDLHREALAAEDLDGKARLTENFHRMGRALRQSLALHARFERDAKRETAEDAERVVKLDAARRARRKAQVKGEIERLIWTEYEPDDSDGEGEALVERLEHLLDAEVETEAFETDDPDTIIERICAALGFEEIDPPSPPAGEGVGRSPDEGSRGDGAYRSSA